MKRPEISIDKWPVHLSRQPISKQEPLHDRIINVKEVTSLTTLSRTTIHRLQKTGDFPLRRKLSAAAIGWLLSDIENWMKNLPQVETND